MSDKTDARIRRKALRAARAVTMGAALVAAGCSAETQESPSSGGWDIGQKDGASADTSVDVANDTSRDVADIISHDVSHDVAHDVSRDVADTSYDAADASQDVADGTDVADASQTCSNDFDQVCPQACEMWNDADCCEKSGGWWNESGGCAVPGPFTPPAMMA